MKISEQFPGTYKDLLTERTLLQERLKEIEHTIEAMGQDEIPNIEAVIPFRSSSQETVRVSGNDLAGTVTNVEEEWDRHHRHLSACAPRGWVYTYLKLGNSFVAVSPNDTPAGTRIANGSTSDIARLHTVWSESDMDNGWVVPRC